MIRDRLTYHRLTGSARLQFILFEFFETMQGYTVNGARPYRRTDEQVRRMVNYK